MTQWYYAQSGQQFGPLETSELVAYLRSGQLGPDTMVWTEGFSQWTAARDVPELGASSFVPETPAAPVPPQVPPQFAETGAGDIPSGPQVRPWVRYWARMVDFFLFTLLSGFTIAFTLPSLLELPDVVFGMVMLFAYLFVEPAMLASWGTTPGKALLRVRLRNADGSLLTYADGLNRAFKVWIRGEGLGIPIVALFTHINAYSRLTKEGITSWDAEGRFSVTHGIVGAGRTVATIAIMFGFFLLAAYGNADY